MATNMRTVVEPTKDERADMRVLMDVLSWAKLEGDAAFGLLNAIGADVDSSIVELANIAKEDLDEAMATWRVGETVPRPPTAMEKGRARAFHRACRICAELEWPAEDTEAWEWEQGNTQARAAAAGLRGQS